tara:strand:- start:145 stop:414 length:270 start_codon:yes stop_codon:yes gene_type:complete
MFESLSDDKVKQEILAGNPDKSIDAGKPSQVWYFIKSESTKIVYDLKIAMNWPNSTSVIDYEKEQIELDKNRICDRCDEAFTDRDNGEG